MKRTIKITESQMKKIIDRISEGEYPMDEATEETIPQQTKTTYSYWNDPWWHNECA